MTSEKDGFRKNGFRKTRIPKKMDPKTGFPKKWISKKWIPMTGFPTKMDSEDNVSEKMNFEEMCSEAKWPKTKTLEVP